MRITDPRTWFAAPRGRHLIVDGGRVGCPRRGDVDMEACFACGHMVGFEDDAQPAVRCDYGMTDPSASMADPFGSFARRSG